MRYHTRSLHRLHIRFKRGLRLCLERGRIAWCLAATLAVALSTEFSVAQEFKLEVPNGLARMRIPSDNPLTGPKIELGKQLFFDARLSKDNTISCATCHDPEKGWSNGEQFATGIDGQMGDRNSPTVINAGFQYFQFWDGRAAHVEGQALGPIQNPIEMNMTLDELEKKLNAIEGYRTQFQNIFGTDVTRDGVAKAIGAFERTILSGDAPYDRFKAGDENALSEQAERGRHIFFNKAQCSACHSGRNFTDGGFHNIGIGMEKEDIHLGRFKETDIEGDRGSFKTPTLREIARTGPYMHDGRFKTLEEVVKYYNDGGFDNQYLDEEIFPLDLTDEQMADLVKFLEEGLSSPNYPLVKPPKLPD